jgi:hypothetical protein
MKTAYSDTRKGGTNWSMSAITDGSFLPQVGGLVLKDIQHDGHNFARDVRLIAFWVFVDVLDGKDEVVKREGARYFLRPSGRLTATPLQELVPTPVKFPLFGPVDVLSGAVDALNFETFFRKGLNQTGYGLRVDYAGSPGMFGLQNFEFDSIDLSQIFLFSHYGTSPPHEPGGVLTAARMHPMIKYEFHKNNTYDTSREHRRLTSIRFDYRFQLYVDAFYNSINTTPSTANNAAAFRDAEISILRGVGFLMGLADASTVVFDAVEKPLVFEIAAPGLAKGASAFPSGPVSKFMNSTPPTMTCWDNVHWWGSGVGNNIISTPGAFHAAHLHWRWGKATSVAPHGSQAQFGPGGVPSALQTSFLDTYGVLVDPRIWIQSIRFAVTINDARLDPDQPGVSLKDLSNIDWKETFQSLRSQPNDISTPSDLMLWYSTEVHRDVTVPSLTTFTAPSYTTSAGGSFTAATAGTVFIHGFFFAHEPEQTGKLTGVRSPLYWPERESTIRAKRTWLRAATTTMGRP